MKTIRPPKRRKKTRTRMMYLERLRVLLQNERYTPKKILSEVEQFYKGHKRMMGIHLIVYSVVHIAQKAGRTSNAQVFKEEEVQFLRKLINIIQSSLPYLRVDELSSILWSVQKLRMIDDHLFLELWIKAVKGQVYRFRPWDIGLICELFCEIDIKDKEFLDELVRCAISHIKTGEVTIAAKLCKMWSKRKIRKRKLIKELMPYFIRMVRENPDMKMVFKLVQYVVALETHSRGLRMAYLHRLVDDIKSGPDAQYIESPKGKRSDSYTEMVDDFTRRNLKNLKHLSVSTLVNMLQTMWHIRYDDEVFLRTWCNAMRGRYNMCSRPEVTKTLWLLARYGCRGKINLNEWVTSAERYFEEMSSKEAVTCLWALASFEYPWNDITRTLLEKTEAHKSSFRTKMPHFLFNALWYYEKDLNKDEKKIKDKMEKKVKAAHHEQPEPNEMEGQIAEDLKRLGLKFKQQVLIGGYTVDFHLPPQKETKGRSVILEYDGSKDQHFAPEILRDRLLSRDHTVVHMTGEEYHTSQDKYYLLRNKILNKEKEVLKIS